MKKLFVLFILLSSILLAQDFESKKMFSSVYFGVLGGTNFNTLPTAGTSISFEVKSNVTPYINGKVSIGYSTLYDDNPYDVRSYRFVSFDDYAKYHTVLHKVDRIMYTIIPISVGAEYLFATNKTSPFALFEFGYNYSSSRTEGQTIEGIAGTYDTVDEIPTEFRKIAPALDGGSSFTLGVGLGLKFMIFERMDFNIRYIYHYNEAIINNNQFLIGFTF